jgi:hypothetical protein
MALSAHHWIRFFREGNQSMNRTFARSICLLFLVGLLLQASPVAALRQYSHVRDGTVVGLNFGIGWAHADFTEGGTARSTESQSALEGGFRFGWARSEYLMYSVDVSGWTHFEQDASDLLFSGTVNVTWFPGGQGFFVRGGVGGGFLQLERVPIGFDQRVRLQEPGWAFTAGLGYEFRLGEEFAIGAAFDYRYLPVGDFEEFTDTKAYNTGLTVNVNWYL